MAHNPTTHGFLAVRGYVEADNATATITLPLTTNPNTCWIVDKILAWYTDAPAAAKTLTITHSQGGDQIIVPVVIPIAAAATPWDIPPINLDFPDNILWGDSNAAFTISLAAHGGGAGKIGYLLVFYH